MKKLQFTKFTKKQIIMLCVMVYVVFFLLFYPKFMSFSDENEYLRATYHLSKGKIVVDDVFDSYRYYERDGKFIPKYPPGNSVILLPFAIFSWKLIFLSGLLLHLLNMFIFIKILDSYKLNRIYSLLYLFYPGFIFYSRTVMSEIPTITFTLLGFYFFLEKGKRHNFLAGLMWGISCVIRPTNALVIVGMAVPSIYKSVKKIIKDKNLFNEYNKRLFYLGLGIIPALIIVLMYNNYVYGGIFNSSYSAGIGGTSIYGGLLAFSNLFLYWKPIVIMLLIYPFMLISPLFSKFKNKKEILWVMALFLVIFGKEDIIRYSWVVNFVIGHRYFFTIIPLMLIPYSIFLDKYFKRFVSLGIICLIIASPVIMYKQSVYTNNSYEIMGVIYDNIPEGSVVVGDWTDIRFFNNYFNEDYSVMDLKHFNMSGYTGEYYLIHYIDEILLSNVHKEADLSAREAYDSFFDEYVKHNNFTLHFRTNNLMVYFKEP